MANERAYQVANSTLRFGWDATSEVGDDLCELGVRRPLVIIDPVVLASEAGERLKQSLHRAGRDFTLFSAIQIEPTKASFEEAAALAVDGRFDGFVAMGGGSTIDTAKAANLLSTHPADFFDYVNAPLGLGKPPPGPLQPLIAVPTTAGTGSESTGTAIFDWTEKNLKTGIAHRFLKPTLAIVDPENTRTQPAAVAASAGLDVLCHAVESLTAIRFDRRPKPARPGDRPAYQGSNPVSDLWACEALRLVGRYLCRAVRDTADDEAREGMLFAAASAGIGFGSAGVHIPHAMGYPVAGLAKDFRPAGYAIDRPLVPHGISVIVHAPAVIRSLGDESAGPINRASSALFGPGETPTEDRGAESLALGILEFMQKLAIPNGLGALGITERQIPELVAGTLQQQRLLKLAPVPVDDEHLAALFRSSLKLW